MIYFCSGNYEIEHLGNVCFQNNENNNSYHPYMMKCNNNTYIEHNPSITKENFSFVCKIPKYLQRLKRILVITKDH